MGTHEAPRPWPPARTRTAATPRGDLLREAAGRLAGAVVVVVALLPLMVAARTVADLASGATAGNGRLGAALAATALLCGAIFFAYSVRYYVATAVVLFGALSRHLRFGTRESAVRHDDGLARIAHAGNAAPRRWRYGAPFVSVQVASYNEEKVIGRLLDCLSQLDYPNYEVIVVDDSTDGSARVLDRYRGHRRITVIHRSTRSGFKGGALREALKVMDARTEYVCIFDADAMPFSDSIQALLPHFFVDEGDAVRRREDVAAVQSYQWHVVNKRESWLTEAVRAEYAGSYMVERPYQDITGAMKMIAGTAYMIRADVLRAMGWGTSITEDWELTCRLYAEGWKVVYTPYCETPAECVGTFRRLVRQRMRWAEGHSFNVRRHFGAILRSRLVTRTEKREFVYYALYYLQALLFAVGTATWLVSDLLMHVHLPDWSTAFGWSLVGANLCATPLLNTAGLLLEGAPRRDYRGVLGAAVLGIALVPFQGWAALKGLLESAEGTWIRTPKTGRVTDAVTHLPQRGWLRTWMDDARSRQARRQPRAPRSRRQGRLAACAALLGLGIATATSLSALTVAESAAPAWYTSGAPSTAVAGDLTLDTQQGLDATAPIPAGGQSTVDFVDATAYGGGSTAAGTTGVELRYHDATCTPTLPCQLHASFGWCGGDCASPPHPIADFPTQRIDGAAGSLVLQAASAAQTLRECPCRFILDVRLHVEGSPAAPGQIVFGGWLTAPVMAAPERGVLLTAAAAIALPLALRRVRRAGFAGTRR